MANFSFTSCLQNSLKVNWRIDDVLAGPGFDASRRWLPEALSGASAAASLNEDERRKLNQIEMAAYAHTFGYVEGFVSPLVLDLAKAYQADDRSACEALTNFASEEVKHMHLFRRIRGMVNDRLGCELDLLDGQEDTVRFVMSKSTGAVLLLTACIEWMTQGHYRDCFEANDELDPLTKRIFKAHWAEESQHAKIDHLTTVDWFATASAGERDEAINHLIELVAAVDGLLHVQASHDVDNLARCLGRELSTEQAAEVEAAVLGAKRHTFILSGVNHPRFAELFGEVATSEQQQRVASALSQLMSSSESVAA